MNAGVADHAVERPAVGDGCLDGRSNRLALTHVAAHRARATAGAPDVLDHIGDAAAGVADHLEAVPR